MCHSDGSRPPAAPGHGGISHREAVTLTSTDGTAVSAHLALPDVTARAGVVVLPDVRGLHGYYVGLADRLAESGLAAIAIDYFGRTAGLAAPGARDEGFEWRPHVEQTTESDIDADVSAAIDGVRARTRPDLPVITLGFCFGGSNSWRQSAGSLDLAGVAGFYGQPRMVGGAAARAAKPVLMIIAGADGGTSVDDQLALADTMRTAGADVTAVVYDGAPHSFFDRSYEQWADACADAWGQVLAFVDRVS